MKEEPDPLAGLEPPPPPDSLRHRVLSEARQALARGEPADIWTRLWESPALRLAWGTTVLVLILLHTAVAPRRPAPVARRTGSRATPTTRDIERELAAIGRLGRLDDDVKPLAGNAAARRKAGAKSIPEKGENLS